MNLGQHFNKEDSALRVLHVLSGDLWGGSEAQMRDQLVALKALGLNVQVLLFNEGQTFHNYCQAKLNCSLAPESQGLQHLLQTAREIALAFSPQVIVSHGYKEAFVAWRLARHCGAKFIATVHGAPEPHSGFASLKNWVYHFLEKLLFCFAASRVIFVSRALASNFGFLHSPKMRIVYNTTKLIEHSHIPAPQFSETHSPTPTLQRPAILAIGRLVPVKRLDRALEAFAILAQQHCAEAKPLPSLYIVGEGPERENLEVLARGKKSSAQIQFLGFRADVPLLLSQADLLVISSDSEGLPTVLLEALAQSVPVASCAVGGIPEVLQMLSAYPGFLCRCSTLDLAKAMELGLRAKADPEAQAGWADVLQQSFSPEAAAAAHLRIYREVL